MIFINRKRSFKRGARVQISKTAWQHTESSTLAATSTLLPEEFASLSLSRAISKQKKKK